MSEVEPDVDDTSSSSDASTGKEAAGNASPSPKIEKIVPSFDGIDDLHPILTKKERWGWYLYDGANSVFSSVAISGYIPVLVTDMAKYTAAQTADVCQVYIASIGVRPAAYASTVLSISVLIQTILFILTSAMADYGGLRKKIMMGSAFLGAIFTACFVFMLDNSLFWLAGTLLVLSNVCFGYSIVFYNAFLPGLVRSSRRYLAAAPEDKLTVMDKVSNNMGTKGFIVGYSAGVFLLAVTFPIILLVSQQAKPYYDCKVGQEPRLITTVTDSTVAYRIAICVTGCWWFLNTFFTVFWLNPRPGPTLPAGRTYIGASLRSLKETFLNIKKLPHTMGYLVAYFMFSDGYSTISNIGVLFATQELNAPGLTLGIMLAIVPLVALIGNFIWFRIHKWKKIPSKTMVMILLILLLSLPIYGCIGFISGSTIGMKNIWELYFFAAWYGLNVGAIQSFSRTVYLSLTPKGHEAEFFGFYELTDKGSSWIGTAVVAALTQATGSLRYGLLWILAMFLIPIVIVYFVNVEKGTEQAKSFSTLLDQKVVQDEMEQ